MSVVTLNRGVLLGRDRAPVPSETGGTCCLGTGAPGLDYNCQGKSTVGNVANVEMHVPGVHKVVVSRCAGWPGFLL